MKMLWSVRSPGTRLFHKAAFPLWIKRLVFCTNLFTTTSLLSPSCLVYHRPSCATCDTATQLRTTFVVHLCIERSEGGAKGTPRILEGMPILKNLFLIRKKIAKTNEHTPY